jgi:hypothetical protein
MKATHTPGPWSVFEPKSPFVCYEGGDSPATIVSDGVHIATMPGVRTRGLSETARVNARLIASAPDLLAALELIYSNAGESPEWIRSRIGPAISKATGGAA